MWGWCAAQPTHVLSDNPLVVSALRQVRLIAWFYKSSVGQDARGKGGDYSNVHTYLIISVLVCHVCTSHVLSNTAEVSSIPARKV